MKLPFCEMLFLSYLYPTDRFNVAKFHAQMSTKLKKQRHWFNVHSLKSFKTLLGPFLVNSQEVVRSPSPIFLKFYSNCHYPIWWTSAKFERNLSRNGMNIKLFSWGGVAGGKQIIHIWPCLKPYYCQTTLVNNPNISTFWEIDKECPFRDRKSRFIVLLGGFSAITREPLKVCRQVKHCKKGFREIFQIGLTASYVCTWNFWENPLFCFVSCLFWKVLDNFQKNFLPQI